MDSPVSRRSINASSDIDSIPPLLAITYRLLLLRWWRKTREAGHGPLGCARAGRQYHIEGGGFSYSCGARLFFRPRVTVTVTLGTGCPTITCRCSYRSYRGFRYTVPPAFVFGQIAFLEHPPTVAPHRRWIQLGLALVLRRDLQGSHTGPCIFE